MTPRPRSVVPTLDEDDGERSIIAGGLRLVFRREGDRWSHALVADPPVDHAELAASFEAGSDEITRVSSPTYQELHFQAEHDAMLAFLVGQHGAHHFSAVFRFEARGDSSVLIDVDFADRCRVPVDALAATYLVAASSSDLVKADPSRVIWKRDASVLMVEAIADSRIALAEGGRRRTQLQIDIPVSAANSTHRCRYRWTHAIEPTPISSRDPGDED